MGVDPFAQVAGNQPGGRFDDYRRSYAGYSMYWVKATESQSRGHYPTIIMMTSKDEVEKFLQDELKLPSEEKISVNTLECLWLRYGVVRTLTKTNLWSRIRTLYCHETVLRKRRAISD